MRFGVALVALVALASACGKVGTSVEVTLDANPALTTITKLHVTVEGSGRTRDYDVTPPSSSIPPAIKLAILVPPSVTGSLTVTILAYEGTTELGKAAASVPLTSGEVVPVTLTLGQGPLPDLAAVDLRGLDLTSTDTLLIDAGEPDDSAGPEDGGEDLGVVEGDLLLGEDLLPVQDLLPVALLFDCVPTSKDFLGVNEDTASTPFEFTCQNAQPTFSQKPTVEIIGPDAAQFSVTDTCTLGLAQGNTCTATVTFHPDGAGPRSATLYIHSPTHGVTLGLSGLAIGKNGAACTGVDAHCQNNHCTDGYCCDKAAAACGGCTACDVATKEGTCSPVLIDTDPKSNCTTGCYDKCDGAGACKPVLAGNDPHSFCTDVCMDKCDGAGACKPAPSTKACGSLPCTNGGSGHTQWQGTTNGALTCSGSNFNCVAATACPGRLVCDPTMGICKPTCSNAQDCLYRGSCNTGAGTCQSGGSVIHGGACGVDEDCFTNGQTGDDHNLCVVGKCQNCSSSLNCQVGMICDQAGAGLLACFDCDNAGRTCPGSGWGATCLNGRCNCSTSADCFDTLKAPNCIQGTGRKMCGCTFDGQRCFNHETCVGGVCKYSVGITCTSASECATNKCTNGRCAN